MCPLWGAMVQRIDPFGESDSFLWAVLYQMTTTHFSLYLENETQFPLRDAVGFFGCVVCGVIQVLCSSRHVLRYI